MDNRRYCLISPGRNEEEYCRQTLDSVVNQTVQPALWVIVDDGSTDSTPEILAEYAAKHDFIKVVQRDDRGRRAVGPGVVQAFYSGFDTIDQSEFDYVCKLDLDLDLPHGYFEGLMQRMEANPRIGTCSGKPYFPHPKTGVLTSEKCGDEASVGMTKFYRMDCFQDIGGFVTEVGWDGIDCHRCRMLGWIAVSWDDEDIRFTHLRWMGSSQKSVWHGRMRVGYGQYFMGTSPFWMLISGLYRTTRPPFFVGGFGMLLGYFKAWFARKPRYDDLEFRRFLRRWHRMCMLNGRQGAAAKINEEQTAVFEAARRAPREESKV